MDEAPNEHAVIDLTLTIPANSEHIRFARLMGSSAAASLGFDYDTIEDLRIAVSELCTVIVEACGGAGTLTLVYCADGTDGIRVDGSATFPEPVALPARDDGLTHDILDAVAEEHRLEIGTTGGSFMLRMSPTRSPGS